MFHNDQQFAIRLMEHLVVPTFVIDAQSRVLIWNKACERMTGLQAADVIGTDKHWSAFYAEQRPCLADLVIAGRYYDIKTYYPNWSGFGISDFGVSVEARCDMPKIGQRLDLAVDAGPIYNDTGALIAVVETLRDITAQKQAQIELETLAAHDGLTNLANRRSFDRRLNAEVLRCSENDRDLSLLLLDVDYFKLYNDRYGHQAGDECLRTVAATIDRTLPQFKNCSARYGGEEFGVILPETSMDAALLVAEHIREAVEREAIPHAASLASNTITVSIGIGWGRGSDLDAKELLGCADRALYQSKQNGRNRCSSVELQSLLLF